MPETFVLTKDGLPMITKDPGAELDYPFDWTLWLDALPDTLVSHTVEADPGITVMSSSIMGKKVIVWLSGGTVGETYKVVCKIVTANVPTPRKDERTILVKVVNK